MLFCFVLQKGENGGTFKLVCAYLYSIISPNDILFLISLLFFFFFLGKTIEGRTPAADI